MAGRRLLISAVGEDKARVKFMRDFANLRSPECTFGKQQGRRDSCWLSSRSERNDYLMEQAYHSDIAGVGRGLGRKGEALGNQTVYFNGYFNNCITTISSLLPCLSLNPSHPPLLYHKQTKHNSGHQADDDHLLDRYVPS